MTPPDETAGPSDRWVLVPVKSFGSAKRRLEGVLDAADRAELAATMAAHVLAAAAPLPVCVACDDAAVATFAESHGALVAWTPGLGLNGAVEAGVAMLATRGAAYVTVVHADLPTATGIGSLDLFDGVTLAPDHRGVGTNLLRVPTSSVFEMQFGRSSMQRHLAECERRGLAVWVLERDDLAFDVDEPEDLIRLTQRNEGTP
ncbi:MAG TPA: 2-phospho-L-lactate guanylyltransferase [Acidimicrobiales bacterium]